MRRTRSWTVVGVFAMLTASSCAIWFNIDDGCPSGQDGGMGAGGLGGAGGGDCDGGGDE